MRGLPRELKGFLARSFAWILIVLMVLNPLNSSFLAGVGKQDIFLHHLGDLIRYLDQEEESEIPLIQPDTRGWKESPLFGLAKGRNLIMIQLESVQGFTMDITYKGQPVTPFLSQLIREEGTFYFENFFHQLGSGNTSDAEFAANNGLLGSLDSYTYQLYQDNYFKGLPVLLKEEGYSTSVFHGFRKDFWNRENIYPALGFDRFLGGEDFVSDEIEGLGSQRITGVSDREFFRQSAIMLEEQPQPFYSFLITLSSHYPFLTPDDFNALGVTTEEKTICTDYLNLVRYLDSSVELFFQELKDRGLYDNSIIVLYGDHFGMPKSDPEIAARMGDLLGREYGYLDLMRVPFLIHIPGVKGGETISIAGGQLDILPTVTFLLGMEEPETLYLGQNLLTARQGFVPFQVQLLKGSFVNDQVLLEASRDGIFENSRGYDLATGKEIEDVSPWQEESIRAAELVDLSRLYLEKDILRLALEQSMSQGEITQYLSGTMTLPKRPLYQYVTTTDTEGLDRIVQTLKKDPSASVLLSSDQTEILLKEFTNRYSGRSGEPGAIQSVDEEQNRQFLSYKERILPATGDMKVYAKLEYSGYPSLAFELHPENYSPEELTRFLEQKKPAMLVIRGEDLIRYSGLLQNLGIPFLVKNIAGEGQRALAAMLGAYGTVIDEE